MVTVSPQPAQPSFEQIEAFEEASSNASVLAAQPELPLEKFSPPVNGLVLTSEATGNTYTIGGLIGEGSFGFVYEAEDVWQNSLAAKILKPRGTYEQIKAAASQEFSKLRQLRHPNVTHVFDAFEFEHTFYLITERCTSPLTGLFDIQDLRGDQWLLPVARCLLQAVHFLHTNGFAHQDIHFGNIFASFHRNEMGGDETTAVTFKLADFGITKVFEEIDASNTMLNPGMLPPEYLDTSLGPLDHRVDIYHCGLIFLQLLIGKQLQFTDEEILDGLPRKLAEQLSEPFGTAISGALRRHVEVRTHNAMQLWQALNLSSVEQHP